MELTRKQAIKWLSIIRENLTYFPQISNKQKIDALEYAISSLKTDEVYQIMYEGGETIAKDKVIDMLEDLKNEMKLLKRCEQQIYGTEYWNFAGKCQDAIQQKIDALRGSKK